MAVVIRMKRTGRRNRPSYRISVADRANPRDGRTLDLLGVYDPASPVPELRLKLDVERARDWLSRGALPSETVRSIFKRQGVLEGLPGHTPRKRPKRNRATKTRERRKESKAGRAERKAGRRTERVTAKRAAAKAKSESESETEAAGE